MKKETHRNAGHGPQEKGFKKWVSPAALSQLFDVEGYTGMAESRAQKMAEQIRTRIKQAPGGIRSILVWRT